MRAERDADGTDADADDAAHRGADEDRHHLGVSQARAQELLAAGDRVEPGEQLGQAALLEHDAVGAGLEHLVQLGRVGRRGEDDELACATATRRDGG